MNKWTGYRSPLSDSMERFVAHKRALGTNFKSQEPALKALDRYLMQSGVTSLNQIDSQVLDDFFRLKAPLHPTCYNHWLSAIRRFFEWMVNQERMPISPVRTRKRKTKPSLIPFIFKHDDIKHLLNAAGNLRDTSNAQRRAETWRLMILLGYGLGMRISEICNLQVGDIDFERNVLLIANSKFGKSRYLPMGPKVAQELGAYVAATKVKDPTQRVFRWREDRNAIHSCNTWRTFRHLTLGLNLRAGPGQKEPRFHDLRHSFAVNTLLRFYREKKDPSQYLLSLSTFMGHSEPQHTAVYLTITDALLNEANSRFQKLAIEALREVQL